MQISTLGVVDLTAAVESILAIIPQQLADGNVVELGDFGSFWLKTNSEGVEQPEEVRATQITTLSVQFKPGKVFKQALATIQFERSDAALPEIEEPEPG
jgi:predicted histone-like DNA-binding protein